MYKFGFIAALFAEASSIDLSKSRLFGIHAQESARNLLQDTCTPIYEIDCDAYGYNPEYDCSADSNCDRCNYDGTACEQCKSGYFFPTWGQGCVANADLQGCSNAQNYQGCTSCDTANGWSLSYSTCSFGTQTQNLGFCTYSCPADELCKDSETTDCPTCMESFECPTTCTETISEGICQCGSDNNCKDCHSNGCDQCENGFFKFGFDYECQDCQLVFGEGCKHCQDGQGCGQCDTDNGYELRETTCGEHTYRWCYKACDPDTPSNPTDPDNTGGEDVTPEPTTRAPTPHPTTAAPTPKPTDKPTEYPTAAPTPAPTTYPTAAPTLSPTNAPTDPRNTCTGIDEETGETLWNVPDECIAQSEESLTADNGEPWYDNEYVCDCFNDETETDIYLGHDLQDNEIHSCNICHHNGCDECETGYWKLSYQHYCVQCSASFGEGCIFCDDSNGCKQCATGYELKYDSCRANDQNVNVGYCVAL